MCANDRAKHLPQQLAGTVGHQVLVGEVCCGIDEAHYFDDSRHIVQGFAVRHHGSVQCAHQAYGDPVCRRFTLLECYVFSELANPGLSVFSGDVAT